MSSNSRREEFETRLATLAPTFASTENEYIFRCDRAMYNKILTLFEEFGMAFAIRTSSFNMTKNTSGSSKLTGSTSNYKGRIVWSSKAVTYFGIPFIVEKVIYSQCCNGPKYYKTKKDKIQNDPPVEKKTRTRLKPSKKANCSARMSVVVIKIFPDYKLDENLTKNLHNIKAAKLKQLKTNLLSKDAPVKSENLYLITISKPPVHSHPIWITSKTQILHPELKAMIEKYVSEGITSVRKIKMLLQSCVRKNIFSNTPTVAHGFYPSNKTIYNHISLCIHGTKFDQDAVVRKIDEWTINGDAKCFFQGYSEENEKAFMFCYQNEWQQKLLMKYGDILFLDATYKTTKYSLPLFNLAVKTNSRYIIIGIFVIQYETASAIYDALIIFKTWNPNWNPKYCVVDNSDAEIKAVKCLFKCPTYICDFYREQAWERWVKKKSNVSCKDDTNLLLEHFRSLAACKNNNDFVYQFELLQKSNVWMKNDKVIKYFTETWIAHKEKWIRAFFNETFQFIVNINNGIESQHNLFEHNLLKQHTDKTLSGVLEFFISEFFPDQIHQYQYENSHLSQKCIQFNTEVPDFLQDRPTFFIQHQCARLIAAKNIYNRESIIIMQQENQCIYLVQSETKKHKRHLINLSLPHCTCYDFDKFRFPCKHMYAVFLYVKDICFQSLPSSYLKSPYISIDKTFSESESEFLADTDGSDSGMVFREEISVSDVSSTSFDDVSDGKIIISTIPPPEVCVSVENSNSVSEQSFIQNIRGILKNMYDASFFLSVNDDNKIYCSEFIEKLEAARVLMNNFLNYDHKITSLPASTLQAHEQKKKSAIVPTPSSSNYSEVPLSTSKQKRKSGLENYNDIKRKCDVVESFVGYEILENLDGYEITI